MIFLFAYCTPFGDDAINRETTIYEITPDFGKDSTLYVWLRNFRIREQPDLSSKVIDLLQFAEEVVYLGEVSDTKSQITLRGKTYNAPWIKIKTKDGNIGWVYSVGVKSDFIKIYTESGYPDDQISFTNLYEDLSPFIPNHTGNRLVAIEPVSDPASMTRAIYSKEFIVRIRHVGEKQRTGEEFFTFEWGEGPVYEVLQYNSVPYGGFVVEDRFLESRELIPISYILDDPNNSQTYKGLKSTIEEVRKWEIQDLWVMYRDDGEHYLATVLHEEYRGYVMLSIVLVTPKELIFHDHIREYREGEDLFRVDDMGEFDPLSIGVEFLFKTEDGYELIYYWDGAEGSNIYIVKQHEDRFFLGRIIYQPIYY
jgi:hypothetical protein